MGNALIAEQNLDMNEIIQTLQTLFANTPFTISIIINLILGLIGGKILVDESEIWPLPPTMPLSAIVGLISTMMARKIFPDPIEEPIKSAYGLYIAFIIIFFITFILPFFIKWIDEVIWFFKNSGGNSR